MPDSFVHLHQHTEYSILDGAARVKDVAKKAAEDGQPAVGITDHGNMYGVVDFYKACQKSGVKPIIGSELYQAFESRYERPERGKKTDDTGGESKEGRKGYYHITALAETREGYKNLIQLSSRSFLEGYYQKPRVDWELLEDHHDGLIVTSGCLGGQVLQALLRGDEKEALDRAGRFQEIFGKDNFFIEIQDHGIPEQKRTNPQLIEISKKIGAPLLATNDSHYTNQHDHEAHDALLCQPPGTAVLLVDGSTLNIEDVEIDAQVSTWSNDQRRGKMVYSGARVSDVGSRWYEGRMVTVSTPTGHSSRYTHDHLCVARMDSSLDEGNYVNYLMRSGNRFRLGSTQFQRARSKNRPIGGVLGPVARAKEQLADAVWILGVHETKAQAHEEEYYLSHVYNIPTWSFPETRTESSAPRTNYYESLWNRIDLDKVRESATKLLVEFGRDMEYPFWDIESTPPGQRRPVFVRACNLLSGMMVCVPSSITTGKSSTNHGSGAWQRAVVDSSQFSGKVYSIEVEGTHTYVADGIVTHNCVQTGALMSDPDRFKFHGDQHYLKTADEMRHLFRDIPEACDNTLLIGERCNVELEFNKIHLPSFPLPDAFATDADYLEYLTFRGAKKRWGDPVPDHIVARLAYELKVIADMGFSSYFLIAWDFVKYARDRGIRTGPGRGSVAGSAVAYSLAITELDPIKYDLLFERFLNPSRVSMPDADLDYDSRYRDEMIRYAAEKYGQEHVAQIITFSSIKARNSVRDSARVLGYPYAMGDKIAKSMPPMIMGRSTPLHACFEKDPEYADQYEQAVTLRDLYKSDNDYKKIVDVAMGLEDLRRSDGIHAAAVVITKEPLTEYLPIQRKPDKSTKLEGPIVTQYEMHAVEELGLLKMDFLGLRNLDVITDTLESIRKVHQKDININAIPLDDEKTFQMLRDGNSIGVFQLEGVQMRALMQSLAPTEFKDIAALVALYRPGPMAANMHNDYADRKNDRQAVSYLHEDAKEILQETYGLPIYQEQVMRLAEQFAGYSLAEADNLRKACGKKIREILKKERSKFVDGCDREGYGKELGEAWFDIIEPFADYAFNKAHSYGYGLLAYQTAWLKANYPVEYMSALLTSVSVDKAEIYLAECRKLGIQVTSPSVNESQYEFSPNGLQIVFGLGSIKNVGQGPVEAILSEREANGEFKSFDDFCERVDSSVLNKRVVESLAHAGAFDCFGVKRLGLITVYDSIVDSIIYRKKNEEVGQFDLFSVLEESKSTEPTEIPDIEYDKKQKLLLEKEVLGLYVSDHPLIDVAEEIAELSTHSVNELIELGEGVDFAVCGLVRKLERKWTQDGKEMAIAQFEDLSGSIEAIVFPQKYKEYGQHLAEDAIVVMQGRTDDRNDRIKLLITGIKPFKSVSSSSPKVYVHARTDSQVFLTRLKAILKSSPGNSEVFLSMPGRKIRLPEEFNVDANVGFIMDIQNLVNTLK